MQSALVRFLIVLGYATRLKRLRTTDLHKRLPLYELSKKGDIATAFEDKNLELFLV